MKILKNMHWVFMAFVLLGAMASYAYVSITHPSPANAKHKSSPAP